MRSALTMLGVFIGVAALIAMVAVGEGANEAVRKQIESLGTNLVVVVPGATTTGGVRGGFGSASTLTVSDAQAIRREDPAVGPGRLSDPAIGPDGIWQSELDDQYPGRVARTIRPSPIGRSPTGRAISEADDDDAALVVRDRPDRLAPICSPIRESDRRDHADQRRTRCASSACSAAKGQTPFGQDQDDIVMIPFTTAERKVLGVAAPTQQQTNRQMPLYPPPPNPYRHPAAPHRLRQSDLCAGRRAGRGADGDRRR